MMNICETRRGEIIDKDGDLRKIWPRSVLDVSDSLCGRGTAVWEGEMDSMSGDANEPRVVVKDSWTDPLRKYTEGMNLHILEQHQIEGVPTLVSEQQVKTSLRDSDRLHTAVNHSTHFLRSALPRGSVFDLRILSRLISRPVCKLILEFSSLGELLVAYLDYVVVHKNALEVPGVLHRDISPTNLFLTLAKNRTDHSKLMNDLSDEARQYLCRNIQNLQWRGILGDWGYAGPVALSSTTTASEFDTSDDDVLHPDCPSTSPIEAKSVVGYDNLVPARRVGSHDAPSLVSVSNLTADDDITLLMGTDDPDDDSRQTIDLCPLYWTGTRSWMSAQLVMAGPGQLVVHNTLHDLESFFYVLVGICVLYDGPSKQKSEADLAECFDNLFNTSEPSILKIIIIQST
ncbi:hypothetical protein HD554DRAFT_657745 [Boletus coccyginus]|nr:hypothetical protein HD554DRAFT_657745 [Boletus coccyginus]